MKYIAVPILVLGLILSLGLTAEAKSKAKSQTQAPPQGGPRITLTETSFDAGDLPVGGKLSHEFTVQNTGTADLKILKVSAGCGCTVASFDKVIAPGQSGRITIDVTLYEQWAGRRITQSAVAETNDPETRYVSLTVSANLLAKGD